MTSTCLNQKLLMFPLYLTLCPLVGILPNQILLSRQGSYRLLNLLSKEKQLLMIVRGLRVIKEDMFFQHFFLLVKIFYRWNSIQWCLLWIKFLFFAISCIYLKTRWISIEYPIHFIGWNLHVLLWSSIFV